MNRLIYTTLIVTLLANGSARCAASDPAQLIARDVYYREVTIDPGGEGIRATVLFFFANTCPVARRYFPRVAELHQTYASKGVRVLGINASEADFLPDIVQHGLDHDTPFPLLKDTDFRLVKAFSVSRTPEVVVLDPEGAVRYQGRIDNQYRLGGAAPSQGRPYLAEALDALLAGREVAEPRTQAEGCAITLPYQGGADVAPSQFRDLLARNCLPCHDPGEMTLATPTAWTRARDAVAAGFMPPSTAGLEPMSEADRFQLVRALRGAHGVALAGLEKEIAPREGGIALTPVSREIESGALVIRYALAPHQPQWIHAFQLTGARPAFGWVTYSLERPDAPENEYLAGPVPVALPRLSLSEGLAISSASGTHLVARITGPRDVPETDGTPALEVLAADTPPMRRLHGDVIDWSGPVGPAEVPIGRLELPVGARLESVTVPIAEVGFALRATFTPAGDGEAAMERSALLDPRFPARLEFDGAAPPRGPGVLQWYLAPAGFSRLSANFGQTTSATLSVLVTTSLEGSSGPASG